MGAGAGEVDEEAGVEDLVVWREMMMGRRGKERGGWWYSEWKVVSVKCVVEWSCDVV